MGLRFLYILSLLAFTFSYFNSIGQASFQKSFGSSSFYDRGNGVCQTNDGGYAIAGRTVRFGNEGGVDAYLIRTNAIGDTLWTKTFGGNGSEEAYDVQQTKDGGFVMTGYTNSWGNGALDLYMIRTDAYGDMLWHKTYGGSCIDRGYAIRETSDGGFIITGETFSYGTAGVNAFLVRTNNMGDTIWTQTYGTNGIEEGNSIDITNDGGYIITGATNSYGGGDYDIYLIKTDTLGNLIWTKTFGGTGSEEGKSVQQTADGGSIIVGYTTSFGEGGHDVYLVKTSKDGELEWSKTFGGKTDDLGKAVRQTEDGGFIISGYTNSTGSGGNDVLMIRVDNKGEEIWFKTYGSDQDEYGNCVQPTKDGGYVAAGYKISSNKGGTQQEKFKDVYLIKTNAKGE